MCKANGTVTPPRPSKQHTHTNVHTRAHMHTCNGHFNRGNSPLIAGNFNGHTKIDLNEIHVKYSQSCLKIKLMKKKNKISIMSCNCKQSQTLTGELHWSVWNEKVCAKLLAASKLVTLKLGDVVHPFTSTLSDFQVLFSFSKYFKSCHMFKGKNNNFLSLISFMKLKVLVTF